MEESFTSKIAQAMNETSKTWPIMLIDDMPVGQEFYNSLPPSKTTESKSEPISLFSIHRRIQVMGGCPIEGMVLASNTKRQSHFQFRLCFFEKTSRLSVTGLLIRYRVTVKSEMM